MSEFTPAVALPVLPPSDVEKKAVAEVSNSVDAYAQRVLAEHAQPELAFTNTDSTVEPPMFLERANVAEQSQIQAEIDRLRRALESA